VIGIRIDVPASGSSDHDVTGRPQPGSTCLRLWLMTALGLALGVDLIPQIIFADFHEPWHRQLPLPAVLLVLSACCSGSANRHC
jgi:hypothetical protein